MLQAYLHSGNSHLLSGRAAYDYAMTARKRTQCLVLPCLTDLTNLKTRRRSFLRDRRETKLLQKEPYDWSYLTEKKRQDGIESQCQRLLLERSHALKNDSTDGPSRLMSSTIFRAAFNLQFTLSVKESKALPLYLSPPYSRTSRDQRKMALFLTFNY